MKPNIKIATSEGILKVMKIKNGVAYDQFGREIPRRYFRFSPQDLDKEFDLTEQKELEYA